MPEQPRYNALIVGIFKNHYKKGLESFEFAREEIETVAANLKIKLPKNLGDVIYSFRYRKDLPKEITDTATGKRTWIIAPAGQAKYRFHVATVGRIVPRSDLIAIKIPDSTPEIITNLRPQR